MGILSLNIQDYVVSPLFLLLILGGGIGVATFFFLLKYWQSREVKYWLVWQAAASFWAFTYAFEYASVNIDEKIFWSKLSYFGIVYEAVSFMFFALAFSSNTRYIVRKIVIPFYVISTLFILAPYTNDLHHLHWKSYSINAETNTTNYEYGPLFWVFVVYTYAQLLIGIVVIFRLFSRLSGYYRRQVSLIFISALLPLLGNFIYIFHINPLPGFDWTPFTFLITGVLIAINISRFRMFDLVPFARNKLIDIIPDAILVVDKSLRVAYCNEVFLSLFKLEEKKIVGRSIEELFANRLPLIKESIKFDDYNTEISLENNDETQYFDLQINSLFDYQKQQTGRLIILKDITRRIQSEKMTKEANTRLIKEIQEKEKLIQDLDAFSHTVAHDLKGMLSAIVSASDLIHVAVDDMSKEELLEITSLISQTATKTTHITKELLTLASVRKQEIQPVAVNMEVVANDALARLSDMILEKGAKVVFPSVWHAVQGNKAWLEEVLINYFSNAMKYGGTPPEIKISSQIIESEKVKFIVSDNGRGLSAEEIERLFIQFARLDTLRAEGHGLGLSIVKRIVEKLGGEVGVDSLNIPGEGSSFYFILPLAR